MLDGASSSSEELNLGNNRDAVISHVYAAQGEYPKLWIANILVNVLMISTYQIHLYIAIIGTFTSRKLDRSTAFISKLHVYVICYIYICIIYIILYIHIYIYIKDTDTFQHVLSILKIRHHPSVTKSLSGSPPPPRRCSAFQICGRAYPALGWEILGYLMRYLMG